MSNNRRQSIYSSFIPVFPRRNIIRNVYYSVERSLSSIGDVRTALIRESWRHNLPSARQSNISNVSINCNGGRQSNAVHIHMQHGNLTLTSNSFLHYSASTSLNTTSDNENRIGVNRGYNITVQGRDANSSNVSDVNRGYNVTVQRRDANSSNVSDVNRGYNITVQGRDSNSSNVSDVNRDHANYGVVIDTDQAGSSSSPSQPINHTISPEPNYSESMTNLRAASGPGISVCAVCLEDYQEVLRRGHHIVAVSCGHVFCNICMNRFMASHRCPKCRSRITRRILRLHF